MADMTKKKGQERSCYNVSQILERNKSIADIILFAHAFTGCDTTSSIHNLGKTSIFKIIEESQEMQSLIKKSPKQIGDTVIRLFEIIHSSDDSLASIREKKYEHMVLSNRAVIDPSMLPPSPRAAYYHGFRVYHQMKVWRQFRDSDVMPLK